MDQNEPQRQPGGPRPKPNLALLRARMEHGLERADLAEMTGITPKQIGAIERGAARHSRMSTLKAIADALDTDVLVLFPDRPRARRRKRKPSDG